MSAQCGGNSLRTILGRDADVTVVDVAVCNYVT